MSDHVPDFGALTLPVEAQAVVPSAAERQLLAKVGTSLGLAAALLFLGWSVLPLPDPVDFAAHVLFGPLVMCGFVGLEVALRQAAPGINVMLAFARTWGVAAGVCFASMTLVQSSGMLLLDKRIAGAATPSAESVWRAILGGVATVQLGLDVAWDVFVLLATVLFATVLLFRRGVWRALGVSGVVVGVGTLVLNLATFPVPPREAGLIDGGPFTGAWFLLTSVLVLVALSRTLTSES